MYDTMGFHVAGNSNEGSDRPAGDGGAMIGKDYLDSVLACLCLLGMLLITVAVL